MKQLTTSLESILAEAVEIAQLDERQAFLAKACSGNTDLRAQLDLLIENHFRAGSFLEHPAGVGQTAAYACAGERPGAMIGPYKLLEQIGEGGMGLVYVAEQQHPVRRKVALKLIKPGMDSRQVIARFEAERQALAMMDHPNIAKVHDGGVIPGEPGCGGAGRPYFVMELVKGTPITDYCDAQRLTPRQRLALFLDVCHAVQHAHQKGIIHRDLKPSNVLVAVHDVTPVVKVIDFGIAKATGGQLTDKTLYTAFAQLIGTPMYMSPEQAGLSSLDVDTRSDVYSLGVLLYELLTGTTPFDEETLKKAGFDEMRRIVREEEPPRPSARLSTMQQAALSTLAEQRNLEPRRFSQHLHGELDWLVMKALEKDRNRRYESASAFAADVERYLNDEPVQACPPSAVYRLKKFARRHKAGLLAASALLALLGILTGSVGWIVRDRAARHRQLTDAAELALDDADRLLKERSWPQARAAAFRAQSLLAAGGTDEQQQERAANLLKDLDMLALLEDIQLDAASVKNEAFDTQGADASFTQAFRDYGMDIEALPPDVAAIRIRKKPIAVDLIAALDAWTTNVSTDKARASLILNIARQADPDEDPLRRRLRMALEEGEPQTLQQLAGEAEHLTLAPSTVHLLVRAALRGGLKGLGGPNHNQASTQRALLSLLRKTQLRYPEDFWINQDLAFCLCNIQPPKFEESVGFFRAALAVRSHSAGAWLNLGSALDKMGDLAGAIAANQKALDLMPNYAAAHSNHGNLLMEQGDLGGAIASYQKAIALKPNHTGALSNLGTALLAQGDVSGSITACRKAVASKADDPIAHNALGNALKTVNDVAGALAAYQKAIDLKSDYAEAHANLGNALIEQGHLLRAIAACQKAVMLKPDLAEAQNYLGVALAKKGDVSGAIDAFRKAIKLKPGYAVAHTNLGHALQSQGEFRQALITYRRAHELGTKMRNWRYPSSEWIREGERLLELDENLPAYLSGKAKPASSAEQIELANLCARKHLNHASARFYEAGFEAEPGLANDLSKGHRYNAACVAALAGSGQGKDSLQLDQKERTGLRQKVVVWLGADLGAWRERLKKEPDKTRQDAAMTMDHWLTDPDLSGVRDREALAKLPEAERSQWLKFWQEVAALRDQAASPK
jgi:serine/threonine protein kinase/Flp pilus assembly protein TadD